MITNQHSVKAYKIAMLKDLAHLTIDGIVSFAKSIDVSIYAAIDWIKASEKKGFYTHWTKTYVERFPTETMSDEAETFNEMIRHLTENDAVRGNSAYNLSRALQARPDARANKVGYEYILFIGTLAAIAAYILGMIASTFIVDFMEKKWGIKFDTYIAEINKHVKSITDNLSHLSQGEADLLVDAIDLLDAIDNLDVYLVMLAATLDKRHYKNLHVDIDAAKEILSSIHTSYYFYQLVKIQQGKRSDFDSFDSFASEVVEKVVKPLEEIIVHLENFKQAVDEMQEPTKKFKRAAADLRTK